MSQSVPMYDTPAYTDLIYSALQSHYNHMNIYHGGCKLSINIMDPFIRPLERSVFFLFLSYIVHGWQYGSKDGNVSVFSLCFRFKSKF